MEVPELVQDPAVQAGKPADGRSGMGQAAGGLLEHFGGPPPSATSAGPTPPAVAGGTVYVGSPDHKVYTLDAGS